MISSAIKNYYENLFFIFVICPCCGKATPLSACSLRVQGEPGTFGRLTPILNLQEKRDYIKQNIEGADDFYRDLLEEISEVKANLSSRKIKEKIREQGRQEASKNIKRVDPIFTPRKIDPQDVTLLFTPIDFVVFKGITKNKSVDKVLFLTRQPQSSDQEKIVSSIDETIKKGDVRFLEVRISDTGIISYD